MITFWISKWRTIQPHYHSNVKLITYILKVHNIAYNYVHSFCINYQYKNKYYKVRYEFLINKLEIQSVFFNLTQFVI